MFKSLQYALKYYIMAVLRTGMFIYICGFLKDFCLEILKTGPVPKHVALIMDGNRRYAKINGLKLKDGHIAGAEALIHVRLPWNFVATDTNY